MKIRLKIKPPYLKALILARCIQNICIGAYITADTSLVVYTMGPIKSRPFTFALHSLVGVGFLAGTFLVKPFLPEEDEQTKGSPFLETSALQTKLAQLSYFCQSNILIFNI